MFQTIDEFKKEWMEESANTLKIFKALTDESLLQKVWGSGRTLGRLAWHITLTLGEMLGSTGLTVNAPDEKTPIPGTAAEIVEAYKKASESVITNVEEKWTDSMLNDELDMYGEKWTRSFALNATIKHEIHHRAQITVLMRQAGLQVPGIYGPSMEEWTNYGQPAQE